MHVLLLFMITLPVVVMQFQSEGHELATENFSTAESDNVKGKLPDKHETNTNPTEIPGVFTLAYLEGIKTDR